MFSARNLSVSSNPALKLRRLPLPSAPKFSLTSRDDTNRPEVERYIADKFDARYGARVKQFMPELLTLQCNNDISAAVGFRSAQFESLFLERYLDTTADQQLSKILGYRLARSSITEIGNLVSTWRGSSQLLFIALTELMVQRGCQWTIFTATPEVSKLLNRLGLEQIVLCHADGHRLGHDLKNWGSYYDAKPAVTAINAPLARIMLDEHPLTSELLQLCKPLIAKALGDAL
ncbi:Uncharacterised protein [Zhongshania aliphaticivorans]|uniref:Thermostable hemolysin n=1 Tax=Zhongshania aliphaticivorans TaxID=1470434 RepID=A0A5S9N471_9GAMM|nr:thermostable hemolysin [Zhongshania aliphaticivorans]CAA0082325.1 Uncharacterised protein [Zhongshania aliphaticivorans]CAA0084296.1 Uncharacterised protein [Zhongshania aliphaticivorans]